MATCRKIQYPMIESTKKQNVPEPAARPSTPSVMLTAFDVPTMTRTAKMTQPDLPHVDADGVGAGEREGSRGVGPLHGEDGEGQRAHQLGRRLRPLVEPEAAPVVDLDVVVEVTDEPEGHHRADRQVARTREADLCADVTDGVAGHDRAHDGDAAHGRRSALATWVAGPSSRMCWPISRFAEVSDEEGGRDDGEPEGDAPRDEQSEHVPSGLRVPLVPSGPPGGRVRPVTSRQRVARLDGIVEGNPLSPDLLVGLVPFPRAGRPRHRARRPRGHVGSRRPARARRPRPGCHARPAMPPSTSSMMASGSSSRGLSDVTTAMSLRRAATSPMSGRLARSRLPPQPNTESTRPPGASARASREHDVEACRRVGVVHDHREGRHVLRRPTPADAAGGSRDHLEPPRHRREVAPWPAPPSRDRGGAPRAPAPPPPPGACCPRSPHRSTAW